MSSLLQVNKHILLYIEYRLFQEEKEYTLYFSFLYSARSRDVKPRECTRDIVRQVTWGPGVRPRRGTRTNPNNCALGTPGVDWHSHKTSRTGRRHTPPSRRHGADLCHPRTRPLTLSWTRPIGACESPPIALRGRHRARIKIFDFS